MERLTHEADFGLEDWEETLFFVESDPCGAYDIIDIAKQNGDPEFDEILKSIALRLSEIENILGEDYDLDRMRELVEADRAGRCVVLPDVDERFRLSMADGLQDVFNEWSYEDQTVGLFGMSDGEKELANAFIAALKGERDG